MNTEYIITLRKEYIENHIKQQIREELISENNIEKRDIKGYHGREILELLQNADDAYQKSINLNQKPASDLNIEISYIKGRLIISNTGTFFDEEGIKAIVQGNNSPKKGKYIGNKGTGFRSILNWADEVRIYSGEFAVQFSKDIAQKIFEKIKDKQQIQKQLGKEPSLYIPMLAVPENIEHDRPKDRTTIEISINSEKTKDDYSVEKQIDNLDLRILLFLPNVSKIAITTEHDNISYERIISNSQKYGEISSMDIELRKVINNKIDCIEQFKLFRKIISNAIEEDNIKKDIQLAIAVPLNGNINIKHIYSYFPLLDTDSPFNCILHATYSLGDHRNTINYSETNKIIIKEQLNFLINIATIYISNKDLNTAYRILLPTNYNKYYSWNFSSTFSKFDLEDYYIPELSRLSMFETVNNELTSIDSHPQKIDFEIPNILVGSAFNKLLKSKDNQNLNNLIYLISKKQQIDISISPEDLCESINLYSDKWDITQQVAIFTWWNNHFMESKLLPKLLKTQKGDWLEYNQECYFLEGDFDSIELPNWVEVPAIDEKYQNAIIDNLKNLPIPDDTDNNKKRSAIRYVCQNKTFPLVNFKYKDRNNIIPTINTSVKNDYNKAVEFVKWLWQHYGHNWAEVRSWSYNVLNFPSSDKNVVSCNKLYWDEHYNNTISNKLFLQDFHAFPDNEIFDVSDDDKENFKAFIQHFGVRDFPKIEIQDITDPLNYYDKTIKNDIMKSGVFSGTSTTYITYCKYKLPYISDLKEILKNLKMADVVKWILEDHDLSANLDATYCSSEAIVKYHGNNQWNGTETKFTGRIRNYILVIFNNSPWIYIDNKHYAPCEVLNGFTSKNNQKFKHFVPVLTTEILEDISKDLNIEINDVISVMSKFLFVKNVTNLPSNKFYGLLLDLQESNNPLDQELSRVIYRIVESSSFNITFDDSENRKKFFTEGKLLVRYQGILQYYPARQSYLPSQKIINKKIFHIVEKNQRTNNSNFVRIFGCKEYTNDYTVILGAEKISHLDDRFQSYFREFIKYARAYSERNENISNSIDSLRITLVSELLINENNVPIKVQDNYSLIRDTLTNWYIILNKEDYDTNELSVCIENIFTNIANTPGFDSNKIGELFRASSKENREFLIQKEFGSLSVIGDIEYYNVIKQNFVNTLKKLKPEYELEEDLIDFNKFESPSNYPLIIKLFNNLNIDIEDFRKAGFVYAIDIRGYLKTELDKFIRSEIFNFQDSLFTAACSNQRLQKDFISKTNQFKSYADSAIIINSVKCNPINDVKKIFGEWQDTICPLSALKVYSQNYEKLNPEDKYRDEIANDIKVQTMIYFNLKKEFDEWLNQQNKTIPNHQAKKEEEIYTRYRSIIPQITTIETRSKHNELSDNDKIKKTYHQGVFSRQNMDNKNHNLKQIGNIGELLIYNLLTQQYGKMNIHPRSEAFVDLGILKSGLATSGEYDLSYIDNNKEEIYVEVKTGHNNTFYISPDELKFAKEHASHYYIYYVYDINTKEPKYKVIPTIFWENDTFHITEIIEKYKVTF